MPVGGSMMLPFQVFVPDTLGDLGPISVDERFSTLVSTLMPEYVQNDHQKFVVFIKAYFEYLEIQGNPRAEAVRLGSYTDIDRTLDDFVQYFKSTYLNNFPDTLADGVSDKLAVINSSDFYGEKGNIQSINYLFNLLFDTPASVETPKDKLFKISDADYEPTTILFTSHYNGQDSVSLFKGSLIEQRLFDDFTSDVVASALIDDITFHLDDGVEYAKIFLKEVRGTFKPNHYVEFYRANRNRKITERTFPIVSNLSVTKKGRNYAVGDDITVSDSSKKLVLSSEVRTVNSLGEIQSISSKPYQNKIYFPGETYTISVFSASGVDGGFTLDGASTTSTNKNNFTSSRSLLSSESFIQDNFRFQSYSYVIKAEKQLKEYADLVKKIFHPAGSVMLSEFTNVSSFIGVLFEDKIYTNTFVVNPVIGNFMPYTFSATADFRGDTYGVLNGDFYPEGFNGITAATIGNFDGLGDPAKHDPYNSGTFVAGPIGGFTFGDFDPDFFIDGSTKEGYTRAEPPQSTYVSTDDSNSQFYIVSSHPKTFLTQNLASSTVTSLGLENVDPVTNRFIKSRDGVAKILTKTIKLYFDTSAGISTGFAVDDLVRQKIPNKPEAIGKVISVDELRDSSTNFYSNKSVNEIIAEFNRKRSSLDLGVESETDTVVTETVESGVGSKFTSSENTFATSNEASFATSSDLVEVDLTTFSSGKTSLTTKTTENTPQDIIKENPDGNFKKSVANSEVISGQTLKASAITIRVLSGEFSNEADRQGNRFSIKSDNTGEAFLASGLNTDKSVKGTASSETISAAVPEFLDINIGDFLNYLELGN
tara:strand:+ start:5972 stop:8431 length:2460 start_codon:yes stop_codon:yes gene_type:complete